MKKILSFLFVFASIFCSAQHDAYYNGWGFNGNTIGNNNSFLGTIDNRSVIVKTNNIQRFKIDSTGLIFAYDSYQLGSSGVNGLLSFGGGAVKLIGGATSSDIRLCTPNALNGRLRVVNSTNSILVGDIASATDNTVDPFQVIGSMAVPILRITGVTGSLTPRIDLVPSGSQTSVIQFLNSTSTSTYLAISANIATGELQYFARSGGYFPTFYSNGAEKMRIASGGQVLIGNTSATASLNVTGTGSVSSNFTSGATITGVNLNISGTNTLTGNSTFGAHIIGTSSAPTSTLGVGAGVLATATLTNCTDISGRISITTAGTPTGANAAIITLTFNSAFATAPKIAFSATGPNSAGLNGTTQVYPTSTTTTFLINSGTVGLTTGTIYTWDYTLTQ